MTESLSLQQSARLDRLLAAYPEAIELGARFAAAGHELYLVGGIVRDALLDAENPQTDAVFDLTDLDFATSAQPEVTEGLLQGWASAIWLTGAAYGTVSCRWEPEDGPARIIEITTFRSDTYEPGSRHPEVTYGRRIEDDLGRRDLTVNAMALRVPDGTFVDPYAGVRDLTDRRLRTPIDPQLSFGDDPLRMVRLARFAAVLDAVVDDAVEAAAIAMSHQLATISAERIRDELVKLLASPRPRRGIELLVSTGLARWVLPELLDLQECRDPAHRHKDVYLHTLAVVDNVQALEQAGPDVVLRLAALLHDIGKPQTRQIHRNGTVTFHHHDVVGARMSRHRLRELRFDKTVIRDASELVRLHLRFHTYKQGWTDAAVRRYVNDAGDLLERLNLLTRADVTTGNARRAAAIQRRVDELELRVAHLREQEQLEAIRPAIDGNRIMRHLGIEPGPVVGQAWQYLLDLRLDHGEMTEQEALAALDEWWQQR